MGMRSSRSHPILRFLMRAMDGRVAICAKRDQVLFRIFAAVTAKLLMVDDKVCHRSAELASPTVAPQHVLAKLFIFLLVKPERRPFFKRLVH